MSKIEITKDFEWDAAHRVLRHESKCATLHGHRYRARVTVSADRLDDRGRVVDFSVLKARIGRWIDDYLDHTTIVNREDIELILFCAKDAANGKREPFIVACEPTAENIADLLFQKSVMLLSDIRELSVVRVEVFETPTSSATYCEAT